MSTLSPLFLAKTRPPKLPAPFLPRPRLASALRQATRRRVVLVRGPAGAGKTTVLSHFARSVNGSSAWYTVDDLDDGAGAFLHGLSLAVGCTDGNGSDQRAYLAQIVGALERRAEPCLLILDDVHRLIDAAAAQSLGNLIRYLPPNVRLILAGRCLSSSLDSILDWCSAQKQLRHVTWDDLRLSEDERSAAEELFRSQGGESWILARSSGADFNLPRYIRREVVEPLEARAVDLLSRLAILPSFDARLGGATLGIPLPEMAAFLDRIIRETPLLETVGADVFRFGESAREVLLGILDPVTRRQIEQGAGLALRPIDPVRSAECLSRAGDASEAARSLATIRLLDWFTQSPNSAHDLLDRLPDAVIRAYPRLLLARAWGMLGWHGRTRDALSVLSDMQPADLSPGLREECRFWKYYLQVRGHLALGDVASARSEREILRQSSAELRRDLDVDLRSSARVLSSLAVVEALLDDTHRSIVVATQGLALANLDPSNTREERIHLRNVLGNIYYRDGDYERATTEITAALQEIEPQRDPSRRAALVHILAGIARSRGQFALALELLERALGERPIAPRERALLTLQVAHTLVDLGDFRGAGERYRTVASWLREPDRDGSFGRSLAGLAGCCTMLDLGDEAASILGQLRRQTAGGAGYDLLLAEGIYLLRRGELREAEERFSAAVAIIGTPAGRRDGWQAALLTAQAQLRQGRERDARTTIDEHRRRFESRVIPAVAKWVREPVDSLLDDGVRSGRLVSIPGKGEPDHEDERQSPRLRHVVLALDRVGPATPRVIDVHLFGPPGLLVDGKDVVWPRGTRRKSIELFWYSVLHAEGFTREQAQADLFPEHEGESARNSFRSALSDLRRALASILGIAGDRVVVHDDNDKYRFDVNAAASITLDTRVLADLADELRQRRQKPPPTTIPEVFRGELLAGWGAEWIEPMRRYWMTVYLRSIAALATRYAQRGEPQQAIRCYELSLRVDSTNVQPHVELLRLYHAMGDRQAMEAQMWLYRRVVRDELALAPDDEVENLFRELADATV